MSVCKLLGLTQEETARILGVQRGQLSMYEVGKRDLPTVAIVKLNEILLHLKTNASKNNEALIEQKITIALQKALDEQIDKLQHKIDRLKIKSAKAKSSYKRAHTAVLVLHYEIATNKVNANSHLVTLLKQYEKKMKSNAILELECEGEYKALQTVIKSLYKNKSKLLQREQ